MSPWPNKERAFGKVLGLVLAAPILSACSSPATESGQPAALVDSLSWVEADASMDNFPGHVPERVDCAEGSIVPGAQALDIDTEDCNFALAEQPLQLNLEKGDWLAVEMGHLALFSAGGQAEGHMAVSIGDAVIWERTVSIPHNAELYVDEFQLDRGFQLGKPVTVHLHNHGSNEWKLYSIARRSGEAEVAE